jgi:hypothetical protein
MSNLGYLSWNFWGVLLQIWPVLLVSLGLTMLLGNSRWVFLGPLVLVAAVVYTAVAPTSPYFGSHMGMGGYRWQRSSIFTRPWDASVKGGELQLEFGVGQMVILGSGQQLFSGDVTHHMGAKPVWAFEQRGNKAVMWLKGTRNRSRFMGDGGYRGSIMLGSTIPWEVDLALGVGNLNGDFRNILLRKLDVEVGVGSIDITLPDKGIRGDVRIDGGVTSVNLRMPHSVGVRIQVSNPIGIRNLQGVGLKKAGQYWISENYDTASSAYDITISTGINKLQFEYLAAYPQI